MDYHQPYFYAHVNVEMESICVSNIQYFCCILKLEEIIEVCDFSNIYTVCIYVLVMITGIRFRSNLNFGKRFSVVCCSFPRAVLSYTGKLAWTKEIYNGEFIWYMFLCRLTFLTLRAQILCVALSDPLPVA